MSPTGGCYINSIENGLEKAGMIYVDTRNHPGSCVYIRRQTLGAISTTTSAACTFVVVSFWGECRTDGSETLQPPVKRTCLRSLELLCLGRMHDPTQKQQTPTSTSEDRAGLNTVG
jgi:hypothetical protein